MAEKRYAEIVRLVREAARLAKGLGIDNIIQPTATKAAKAGPGTGTLHLDRALETQFGKTLGHSLGQGGQCRTAGNQNWLVGNAL